MDLHLVSEHSRYAELRRRLIEADPEIDETTCCFSRRTEPGFPSRSEPPLIMDFGSG